MKISSSYSPKGVSMIELLCCIAIITILVGLLAGPVAKAFKRAKALVYQQ